MYAFNENNIPKSNLTLVNSDGEPLYNLIIVNGGSLSYENSETHAWVSYLTSAQWAYIEEYEAKYHVRRVSIDSEINIYNYIDLYDQNDWGKSVPEQKLIPADNDVTKKIFEDTRVKFTAPLDVNNIYHTRIKITDESIVKPFLYYDDNGSKGAVAATISTFPDGREKMSFYFGFGSWSQSSIILNHLWLVWGTRNIFNGFRRVYFSAHIDDVFLSTDLIDMKKGLVENEEGLAFRTSSKDYDGIVKFQNDIMKKMPDGSFFRVELAFNGNGIIIQADPESAVEVDGERYVDLEFVKTPGTGDKRWPKENYQLNFSDSFYQKDPLFKYFANNDAHQKEFFWSSHTFSHENLDNASRSDVDNEIRVNIELAKKLGVVGKEWWSEHAIITPQISGLHNKDALEIFRQYGITAGTGDLSRPAITNLENPYLPFYTTLESSNLEGFPIIPRTPTEIYYMCTDVAENTWMYNHIYKSYFGKESTWEEISDRESKRTLLLMTKLRHEAHQFHQANLRNEDTGKSLLEEWVTPIVNLYNQYVEWPLISLKIDDNMESFKKRANIEACGQKVKLIINDNKVTGISVSATKGDCTLPVTVPVKINEATLPQGITLEQVGKDPLTVWVSLVKGETKIIEFAEGIEWKINEDTPASAEPSNPTTTTVIGKN
ncbi:hypothetical protein BCR36DRAFT_296583 [Piromyces finnis]|uniref:Uncharacterized protein n=1 Tax=Piromyces finnis TaxID=1754191 RepID=A0A1Y1V4C1_9FUNG|nr:hypothetical protein BCR36DRAFT_296583 [Piromyces finnis]|eukprot:ORX46921.1 hypothetical protein BCR36DRAFT_296583 [Piromyces finnis]